MHFGRKQLSLDYGVPGSNPGSPTFFKTFIVKSPLKRHFSGLFCYPDKNHRQNLQL